MELYIIGACIVLRMHILALALAVRWPYSQFCVSSLNIYEDT